MNKFIKELTFCHLNSSACYIVHINISLIKYAASEAADLCAKSFH